MQPPLLFPVHPHPVWQQPEHRLHERLPQIARRLRIARISTVRVEYEGHWGIAHIDLVSYYDADNNQITPKLSLDLSERVDDCFRDLLEARYPKWANGEGAFGLLTWRLLDSALTHEHNTRYVAFKVEIHEGI